MRITINTNKINTAADLQRALRSLAAKIDVDSIVPGADLEIGNVRVQVAEKQVSDIRAFALKFGFPVGARGRYSRALSEAWEVYSGAADKRTVVHKVKALAAEARGEVEAPAELVEA